MLRYGPTILEKASHCGCGVRSPRVDTGLDVSTANPADRGSSVGETPTKEPKSELEVLTILEGRDGGLCGLGGGRLG